MSFEESKMFLDSSIVKEEYSVNQQPQHYAKLNESPTPNSRESVQFVIEEVEENKTTKMPFQCKICLKGLLSKRSLELHHKFSHSSDPIPCDICKKILKNSGTLKRHLKIHDNERKRYKCDQCEATLVNNFGLHRHMYLVHKKQSNEDFNSRKLTCEECGKMFLEKHKLDKHMLTHAEVKDIKCSKCSRKFKDRTQLARHMDFHRKVKPFMCKICGIPFKTRRPLRQHIVRHTDKAIICPYCKKKYKNRLTFRDHMKGIHIGLPIVITDGPLSCTVCEENFENLNDLKDHVKIHDNSESFECGHCGRPFKRKGNMKIHILSVHRRKRKKQKTKSYFKPITKVYNWSCPHCDKIFYMKSSYSVHLTVHSDERPFECKFCKAKFKTKEYMKRHIAGNMCKRDKIVDSEKKRVEHPVNPATIQTEIEEKHENEYLETEIEFTDYVKTEEDLSFIIKTEEILD